MNYNTELDELIAVRNKIKNNEIPTTEELEALHAALINKKTTNMLDPSYKTKPWLKGLSTGDESLILRALNNLGADSPDIIRAVRAVIYTQALPATDNERFFGNDDDE